ncbi:hypothetical protein [Candidatus Ichthyocystis hellenicum]|nr:hypothetical protein [Candidatus Ichthyocystis hellenicum]
MRINRGASNVEKETNNTNNEGNAGSTPNTDRNIAQGSNAQRRISPKMANLINFFSREIEQQADAAQFTSRANKNKGKAESAASSSNTRHGPNR